MALLMALYIYSILTKGASQSCVFLSRLFTNRFLDCLPKIGSTVFMPFQSGMLILKKKKDIQSNIQVHTQQSPTRFMELC
ncbi:hypothetical protein COCC4DRAFT_64624 [Bipolaris maydis ATCC 48331]|uniref:Uncharacterized protein n=2 Tax=Cochliobolus heterostrophus TaxID=5016 RepID=M2U9V9_COCH5|nr:uncharacterized protein COCC4DRAFT_64624 [Bipolaris maydis ATCC 48331]EMD84763.1 hypothetical protein COCHEDRAFT_1161916 [Bipolaris maydis C5]KAJ5031114.1 hypothetical protein J3E73DRAFT_264340 [Bipolaris maydis]EMD97434.1 hypothetical protein COCHEDRAFT_1084338 [Bipolaris maydis C5]ENI01428.1 hypothetical protein COCC4DRAFT_64624 [Bipolaris maydis ATCC 48331]KAJ5052801.1 hypothetical protein J3E74DRAFT_385808 [Bipolaris maydis]